MAEAHPRQIELYVAPDGKSTFEDWLANLKDRQARARIRIRLERPRLGNFGDCKSVGSGVFELRVDYGPGYRVYFGRQGDALVILLCGGDKKSQVGDIKDANKFWEDYRVRQNNESE